MKEKKRKIKMVHAWVKVEWKKEGNGEENKKKTAKTKVEWLKIKDRKWEEKIRQLQPPKTEI